MLKTLDQTDLEQYENVSYISARKVFTCPYVFERTERLEKRHWYQIQISYFWMAG